MYIKFDKNIGDDYFFCKKSNCKDYLFNFHVIHYTRNARRVIKEFSLHIFILYISDVAR